MTTLHAARSALARGMVAWRGIWLGGERDQTLYRVIVSILVLGYVTLNPALHRATPLAVTFGLLAYTAGFLWHVLRYPAHSPRRILLAMAADLSLLGIGLHVGGKATALLYPILLWVILGNGFRFGLRYLLLATLLATLSFTAAVLTTPAWRDQPALAGGLLAGLVLLPIYAITLLRRLSQAKDAAEAANRAKTQFLASVSHELRTPLNAVIGLGHLLQETTLDAEQADMTRTITASGRVLLSLINNILDFARLEAGRMPSEREDFCLRGLLGEVRDIVATLATAKGLRIHVHITARTPLGLHGDRRHLEEVLLNLLGNAVKFTEAGEVVLAVDGTVGESGVVCFRCEVSDTGIGIAPEATHRIFETFTQADSSIINRFGGTGLGLAICKHLVTLMGGEIGVESTLGLGSVFYFTLPLGLAAEAPALEEPLPRLALVTSDAALGARVAELLGAAAPPPTIFATLAQARDGLAGDQALLLLDERHAEANAPALAAAALRTPLALLAPEGEPGLPPRGLRGYALTRLGLQEAALRAAVAMAQTAYPRTVPAATEPAEKPTPAAALRILIAEDNRTNQKVISKVLERAGHSVHVVDNGEQALDALEAESFDLVLMDVNMPVMGGLEAVKLYRFSALGAPRVPIIALTADATQETAQLCQETGMDDCLTKPIEPDRLLQAIARHVPASAALPAREAITDITDHPRFRQAGNAAIDTVVLADLESLGGGGFVIELIDAFLADSAELVEEMTAAARAGDSSAFRGQAHALRSAAANIGAKGLFELCLSWRLIRAQQLDKDAEQLALRLHSELERVRASLLAHRARLQTVARQG